MPRLYRGPSRLAPVIMNVTLGIGLLLGAALLVALGASVRLFLVLKPKKKDE